MRVSGDYTFLVRTHSYSNPTNKCIACVATERTEPGCCDWYIQHSNCLGSKSCDTFFQYCFQPLNSRGFHHQICSNVSSSAWNDREIDFTQATVLDLPNPLSFSVVSTQWMVRTHPMHAMCDMHSVCHVSHNASVIPMSSF